MTEKSSAQRHKDRTSDPLHLSIFVSNVPNDVSPYVYHLREEFFSAGWVPFHPADVVSERAHPSRPKVYWTVRIEILSLLLPPHSFIFLSANPSRSKQKWTA